MTTEATVTEASTKPPTISVEQLLEGAGELAALPQVVMRVIDLTVDPKATASDLERAIGTDQALAAKILTLANSSYYGLPRRISSLREAVVFLGFKSVRSMAMSVTVFNLFLGKSDTLSLARRSLWRHSLDAAQCARVVTGLLHPSDRETFEADEAFTGGLLHDIGKMLLDVRLHPLYIKMLELTQTRGVRFYEVESQILPFNHALVGASLAARWNLPAPLCEAIAFHHTPRAASVNPKLTAVIFLANEIAHHLDTESPAPKPEFPALLALCEEATLPLRLRGEELHAMSLACRMELDKGLSQMTFA